MSSSSYTVCGSNSRIAGDGASNVGAGTAFYPGQECFVVLGGYEFLSSSNDPVHLQA